MKSVSVSVAEGERMVADTAESYASVAIRLLLVCLLTLDGDTSADGTESPFYIGALSV